ncbi:MULTISPECIES: hypothetical protein [unclassified Microcoleus]|uniref:hypothetical protein n=1 Tax=unclassified Microcoleus TaxID=2642155 RepID=UPI0025E510AF|nr:MULTISPECIES: hypothetical protein [unclassified Microcoleus]
MTGIPISHGAFGIEFSRSLGRKVFSEYVAQLPEFTIKWNNRIFLRKGIHTFHERVEGKDQWIITKVVRYVEVDCTDIDSILKKGIRHQSTDNPYAAVLGDKNKAYFESQMLPKDE